MFKLRTNVVLLYIKFFFFLSNLEYPKILKYGIQTLFLLVVSVIVHMRAEDQYLFDIEFICSPDSEILGLL